MPYPGMVMAMGHTKPELHVITSGKQPLEEVLVIVEAAFAGGADYLHIREKHRTAREHMDWVSALRQIVPESCLIVNDRVDVAAAASCRGVPLAWHSLSPLEARKVLKPGQQIGKSVHSFDEAVQAAADGADYVLYGHIFPSASKPGLAPRGVRELQNITRAVPVPVIGLGGITPENAGKVLAAGCAGIAVLSGITAAADVRKATGAYREALDRFADKGVRM